MPPVPPELLPWVSLAKDFATLVAACVGAWVAIKGLNAWRRQLKGKTDYELARKVLRACYKVRDSIASVRHPAIWSAEFDAAQKKVVIDDPTLKDYPDAAKRFAVYQVRWTRLSEALSELDAEAFEAEVSWETPIKAKLADLRRLVGKLRWAINEHIDARTDSQKRMQPQGKEADDVVFDKGDEHSPDEFSQKVQKAIAEIEEILRPHLS